MPARIVTDAMIKRMRELWDKGYTAPEIAANLGIKPSNVYNYVGLKPKKVKDND